MTGRTHDLAAISTLGIVALSVPLPPLTLSTALIAVLANLIGGVAPDIDQPTAPLWRNLPIGGVVGRVFDRLLGGHRFLTHSLIGLVLFGFGTYYILTFIHPLIPHVNVTIVLIAFMIGMISHLVMDSFTKEGVPWLLPIPYKFGLPPLRKFRLTTGKIVETLMIFPGIILFDSYYCSAHYHELLLLAHHIVG
jgi:inner membrane protein